MSDMIDAAQQAEFDRLNRISSEAHGVLGMFDAVIEAGDYTSDQLWRVIRVAHTRLETACTRESEAANG